jgi:hypothetical protein
VNRKLLFFALGFGGMALLLLWYIYVSANQAIAQIASVGQRASQDPDWFSANGATYGVSFPWNRILSTEANAVDTEANTILTDYFDNARDAAGNKIGPLMGEAQILESEWSDLKSIYSELDSGSSTGSSS